MHQFRTDDHVRINFVDEGRGDPILLVHGWMMSSRAWRRQIEGLRHTHRIIAPDLRGCGESQTRAGTYSVERYAKDLRLLMERVGGERWTLVGWSMGGGIVMDYLQRFGAQRVGAVGLVDFPPRIQIDQAELDRVVQNLATQRTEFLGRFIKRMFLQPPDAETLSWMLAEAEKCTPQTAGQMYQAMRQTRLPDAIPTLQVPAFLAFPENGWFRSALQEWKTIFPRNEAPSFPASKHCPFLEEADAFNQRLRSFLDATVS